MISLKKPDISSFALKIIAILSMLVDHTGAMLFPQQYFLRVIGRLAFPIFAFLIVEGYTHTKNVYRYMGRLALFAILSEIPFNLLHSYNWFDLVSQNIFFTLLIALVTIHLIHKDRTMHPVFQLLIGICSMVAAELLRTDYGYLGVLTVLLFYLFRESRSRALLFVALLHIFVGLDAVRQGYYPFQCFAAFAVIFIAFYHGRKGPSLKYFFYIFYPAHIIILTLINHYHFAVLLPPFALPSLFTLPF